MLEVFINYICALIMAFAGFYIIKKIIHSSEKINIKTIIVLLINCIFTVIIHYLNYNVISVLLDFILNIVTYKIIFKISIEESIIAVGILSILIIISDMIDVFIHLLFIPHDLIQGNIYIFLLGNIIVSAITILIIKIKVIESKINNFYKILSSKNLKLNILFVALIMIGISGVVYSIIINFKFNLRFFTDVLIMSSLIITSFIFARNRESYSKLSKEYDVLLLNVQNFEEWIEKEQFIRHEYKNQLAVLYSLTKEKAVKEKIEDIIKNNLNIENEVVYNLKVLPKGTLKGILYYKAIIAEQNKIKLTTDISINKNSLLNKLSKKRINELSKILGIYFDNAIEAAKDTRKKIVSLEIYELKDKINIIISNTFKKDSIIDNNVKKGVSSKGRNRGKGLYFASKIINNNSNWLVEKHEIVDNYYVEIITITKSTSKK